MTRIRNSAPVDPNDRFAQQIKGLQQRVADLERRSLQSASFTPTLTALVMGTGGSPSNTAVYTYSGGLLIAAGVMVYGNTGRTFPSSTSRIGLPAGFSAVVANTVDQIVGQVTYRQGSTEAHGPLWLTSTTTVRPLVDNAASTYLTALSPSSTIPFTWAAGDAMTYQYVVQAVRS